MTVVGRQTACRMRHYCARRIDETGGRRELLRTSTRWAERQRIIGAEANRIAMLTRLCRAQAVSFRRQKGHSSLRLPIKSLSLGVPKGPFSFAKENGPFDSHPCAAQGYPRCTCAANSQLLYNLLTLCPFHFQMTCGILKIANCIGVSFLKQDRKSVV